MLIRIFMSALVLLNHFDWIRPISFVQMAISFEWLRAGKRSRDLYCKCMCTVDVIEHFIYTYMAYGIFKKIAYDFYLESHEQWHQQQQQQQN